MVTFLNNLPSFDKDNFSNFQPDPDQFVSGKKTSPHSFVVGALAEQSAGCCCNGDDSSCSGGDGEQIIVNQRCNLIIQYLDKHGCGLDADDERANNATDEHPHGFALAEKSKKRAIREVLNSSAPVGGAHEMQVARTSLETDSDSDEASPAASAASSAKQSKKRRTGGAHATPAIQNTEASGAAAPMDADTDDTDSHY